MLLKQILEFAIIAWLPGAVVSGSRGSIATRRASLDAEERLFWAVVLSVAISVSVVLALAAVHRYSFQRLLVADIILAGARRRIRTWADLRLGSSARRLGMSALVPLALVLFGLWRFFPPAEYIIGGKDPGTYVNEGVQIAQRGTLVVRDPVVEDVPPFARDLFFPSHQRTDYYGTRFMGFFIRNPADGSVVGQFPHLFPASIAIGYGRRPADSAFPRHAGGGRRARTARRLPHRRSEIERGVRRLRRGDAKCGRVQPACPAAHPQRSDAPHERPRLRPRLEYAHDYDDQTVAMECLPESLAGRRFYEAEGSRLRTRFVDGREDARGAEV